VVSAEWQGTLPIRLARYSTPVSRGVRSNGMAGQDGWHQLEVEVGAEDVRVWCDGQEAGTIAVDVLERKAATNLVDRPGVRTGLNMRGGIGLYALNGAASLRNVILNELPRR
jgi:hypothetical protein